MDWGWHVFLVLGVSWLVQWSVRKISWLGRLGDVITAYGLGIILRNAMPFAWNDSILDNLASLVMPVALILMLAQSSLQALWAGGRPLVLAWALQVLSVILFSHIAFFLWGGSTEARETSSLAVSVYTGGIINLGLLSQTLKLPPEKFGQINLADIAAGAVYLFVMMNLGRFVFRHEKSLPYTTLPEPEDAEKPGGRVSMAQAWWPVPLAFGVLGLAAGCAWLVNRPSDVRLILFLITAGGLLLSLWPALKNNRFAGLQADFLVTVFSLCMGLMANLKSLTNEVLPTAFFLTTVLAGSVALHFAACRLLRLPDGLFVATSAGGIMSPPFVPGICQATHYRAWIPFGVAAGLAGNSLGTWLGLLVYEGLSKL